MTDTVLRLRHSEYVHINDNNTNAITLHCGPAKITLQSHQTAVQRAPAAFELVDLRGYTVIENPVARDGAGDVIVGPNGQAKNKLGEREIRFFQQPFPLYPLETVVIRNEPLPLLTSTQALVLRAITSFDAYKAGDEFLFQGPGTYIPRVEVEVVEKRDAIIVLFNQSLRLRAKNKFVDRTGTVRQVGEEYLWNSPGAFMLGVNETLQAVVATTVIGAENALHVLVSKGYTDKRSWANGVERRAGEVYLVTAAMTSEFVAEPQEKVIKTVPLIKVNSLQFAVIHDPVGPNGKPQLGRRKVVTDTTFFLQPGETLDPAGIVDAYVLGEDEAVLVKAVEEFTDTEVTPAVKRVSGEQWLLRGPRNYIPTGSVRVAPGADGTGKRRRLILGPGEGVYVRNILSGDVRAVVGVSYMLEAYEELWSKELSPIVEEKLSRQLNAHAAYMDGNIVGGAARDKTRLVNYHIPHNSVTQVFDYKVRTRRTIFGPDKVTLGPDEEFTVLNLSGSDWDPQQPNVCQPKQTDKIKALYLFLGPSNLSDVVKVETRDHARLSLQLSYDWYFDVEERNIAQADECFNVPDFVGDCCSCIASRVRATIASVSFEYFHKNSASILRSAVFGNDDNGQPKAELRFPSNRLVVTSIDIQEIVVIDDKTREALKQSVKVAIEITTQGQEATARQEASVREQTARGKLERQQIQDKSSSEVQRKKLIEAETQCASIASTGRAKAEARARAVAATIDGDLSVQLARIHAAKDEVMDIAQLEQKQRKTADELQFLGEKNELEIAQKDAVAKLESSKFGRVMDAVGKDTVQQIAKAGPEMQAKILGALGLQGYLVTDGTNPINLFNTAKGLTAAATAPN